jgi:hypothetical protein
VSHQPVHERTGKTPRRCLGQGRQVVYVKDFPPRQELGESETGGALDHAVMLQRNDPVGLRLLPSYLGQKRLFLKVWPESAEGWKARQDLLVRIGHEYVASHRKSVMYVVNHRKSLAKPDAGIERRRSRSPG